MYQGARHQIGILALMLAAITSVLSIAPMSAQAAAATAFTWAKVSPSSTPTPRGEAATARDNNGRVLLFGGASGFDSSATVFNESWEWTGSQWLQLHPASSPSPRSAAMMAFDPTSQKTILFGGSSAAGTPLNDTWQFDGSNWMQLQPATSPPPRYAGGMAADSHPSIVLFGGWTSGNSNILGDTWRWDGSNWSQLSPASPPSARTDFGFSYDPVRARDVMFGGRIVTFAPSPIVNETWEWNGTTSSWSQASPASSPPPTQRGALVYDGTRTTLFGGAAPLSYSSQTWQWDGTNWSERVLASPPSPRALTAIVWDPVTKRDILFGGIQFTNAFSALGDTWKGLYYTVQADPALSSVTAAPPNVPPDGTSQAQVSVVMRDTRGNPIAGVSVRVTLSGAAAASVQPSAGITDRNGLAVFTATSTTAGKATFAATDLTDSLNLNQTASVNFSTSAAVDWKQVPYVAPYPTRAANVAFDSTRNKVVLFGPADPTGGIVPGFVGDTWELADGHWTQRHPTASPPVIPGQFGGPSLAYDPIHKQTILFSPITGSCTSNCGPGQTWSWNGTNWIQLQPAHSPPSRSGAAMSWDPSQQRIVLFGGDQRCPSGCFPIDFFFADTWVWDGTDWSQLTPGAGPTARVGASMAPDGTGQLVLFGGSSPQGNVLADTWTWNGSAWAQQTPTVSPSGRYFFGIALDTTSSRTMLFGGRTCGTNCNGYADRVADLWQWDGAAKTWTQLHPPPPGPPLVQETVLAYDSSRSRLLLLPSEQPERDGPVDLWEYDGTKWLDRKPSWPTQRTRAQMVYDSTRNVTVMVAGGGVYGAGSSDTWEWDGAAWHQRHPSKPPSLRLGAAAAFDAARGKTVLFGGTESSTICTSACTTTSVLKNDTWTWDGTSWTKLPTATSPSPRTGAQMSFDPVHNVVLLFGGQTNLGPVAASSETWQWDGATWTQLHPSTTPPARSGQSLTFDPANGMALLFGGRDAAGNLLGDTYEWDGSNWQLRSPASSPPARADAVSAYDGAIHRVFLFGGQDAPNHDLGDGWTWDGTSWTRTDPVSSPPARMQSAMSYDVAHDQLVLFGGLTWIPTGTAFPDDTWLARPSP
jgi:hypothetical protein